jgi:DNA-binding transcriptional LysR family regulator
MEERIGAQLLERGTRGVKATAAGEVLLNYACKILDLMEQMDAELSGFASGIQGHIRVVAPISEFSHTFGNDIGEFLRCYENVRATVEERVAADTVRAVEEGRADIGICWEFADTRHLRRILYRSNNLYLVVRPSHALASRNVVAFADVLEYNVVTIPGILLERMQKEAAATGKALRSQIQVASIEAICNAVIQGLGVAVIPRGQVDASADLVAIPISDDWTHQHFIICVKEHEQLTLPTRLLIESLTENAVKDEAN